MHNYLWNVWKTRMQYSPLESSGIVGLFAGLEDGSLILIGSTNSGGVELFYNWYSVNPNSLIFLPVKDLETGEVDHSNVRVESDYSLEKNKGVWYYTAKENAIERPSSVKTVPTFIHQEVGNFVFLSVTMTFTKNGAFHSYMGVDRTTESFSVQLKEAIESFPGSAVFLIEKTTGYLISSSFDEYPVFDVIDGKVVRHTVETYPVSLVKDVGSILQGRYGKSYQNLVSGLKNFDEGESFSTTTNSGKGYFVNYGLVEGHGMSWILVMTVSQSVQISTILIFLFSAIGVAIVLLIVSAIIALVYGIVTIRPFLQLRVLMELAAEMKLDEMKRSFSFFSEVAQLQSYFFRLVDRMRIYRAFLPQHLLESLDEQLTEGKMQADQDMSTQHSKMAPKDRRNPDDISDVESQVTRTSSQGGATRTSISKGGNAFRFEIGLESRNATVMDVHIENIFALLENTMFSREEVVDLHADILEIVRRVARVHQGQVTSFGTYRITVMWSASTTGRSHQFGSKAVSAAAQIMQQVQALNFRNSFQYHSKISVSEVDHVTPTGDDSESLKAVVSIAIACGPAFMGNLGTNNLRQFTIVGPVMHSIENLSKLNSVYDVPIIVDDVVMREVHTEWTLRPLLDFEIDKPEYEDVPSRGLERLSPGERARVRAAVANITSKRQELSAFEVGTQKKVDMDEWMYELEQQEKLNQWDTYSRATMDLAMHGNASESYSAMAKYCEKHKNDKVGRISLDALKLFIGHNETEEEKQGESNTDNESLANQMDSYRHPDASGDITSYREDKVQKVTSNNFIHPDMI